MDISKVDIGFGGELTYFSGYSFTAKLTALIVASVYCFGTKASKEMEKECCKLEGWEIEIGQKIKLYKPSYSPCRMYAYYWQTEFKITTDDFCTKHLYKLL